MLAKTNDVALSTVPASFRQGMRWYAFYTHIHAEKRAELSVSELGFEVFIPFEKRVKRQPGHKPRVYEAPLFPRYGFVRFDINLDPWGAVTDAKGVVDLLKWNMVPHCVPDEVINGLGLAQKIGVFDRTKPPQIGMKVEVTNGPFEGFIGRVLKARAKDRVDVLLSILGSERSVGINLERLRAVES